MPATATTTDRRSDRAARSGGSAIRTVWSTPFYRAMFISLVLSGISVSSTLPQLSLFLVNDLGASEPVAGLYYLVNLAAPIAGYLVGTLSDRMSERLFLYRICVLLGAVGWLAMALASRVWMPFVIGALALSFAGCGMAQLFAAARDQLSREPVPASARVVATLRMGFSAGWMIGPVFGSWLGAVIGLRHLLLVTALIALSQLVPLGRRTVARFVPAGAVSETPDAPADPIAPRASRLPLMLFVAASTLLMCGDTIKFAYLPLYMKNQLGVSDELRGAVIAIQPLLELALMPLFAWLADRFTAARVLGAAGILGVLANVAYATSHTVGGLLVGQVLMSGLWAAVAGLGFTVAQQLYAEGVGFASSAFGSSLSLAGGIGGAVGAFGSAVLGIPGVFAVPAALGLLGTVGLLVIARRYRPDDRAFAL